MKHLYPTALSPTLGSELWDCKINNKSEMTNERCQITDDKFISTKFAAVNLRSLHRHRHRIAAAETKRDDSTMRVAALQFIKHRRQQA